MDFRFSHFYATPNNYHFWSGLSEDGWYSIASLLQLHELGACGTAPCTAAGSTLGSRIIRPGPATPSQADLDNPYYLGAPVDFVYAPGAVSWANNLFDHVNIHLDPTYYEDGWCTNGLNVDLSFQAYNNLFRGADWLWLTDSRLRGQLGIHGQPV